MQEILDKMVASVRYGVMDPLSASRTIHECAALLGLQLAATLPGDTVIVSGMPKRAKREDLVAAFEEFGEIRDAAVAPKRRGFGKLLRRSFVVISRLSAHLFSCFYRTCSFQVTKGSKGCHVQVLCGRYRCSRRGSYSQSIAPVGRRRKQRTTRIRMTTPNE